MAGGMKAKLTTERGSLRGEGVTCKEGFKVKGLAREEEEEDLWGVVNIYIYTCTERKRNLGPGVMYYYCCKTRGPLSTFCIDVLKVGVGFMNCLVCIYI